MRRYLNTLADETTARSIEEYLGAFTESLKLILKQNPVERMGHAVLLASKTALRLKAVKPNLKEHEISGRLQEIARNIRLTTILKDLTPEEKRILQLHPMNQQEIPVKKHSSSLKAQGVRELGRKKTVTTKKAVSRKRA